MSQFKQSSAYQAYLVRLWNEKPKAPWRASAQSIQTGETVRFADLEALFAFLQAQTTTDQSDDRDLDSLGTNKNKGITLNHKGKENKNDD